MPHWNKAAGLTCINEARRLPEKRMVQQREIAVVGGAAFVRVRLNGATPTIQISCDIFVLDARMRPGHD
jgi:uncharacterized protein (UPF0303 family)